MSDKTIVALYDDVDSASRVLADLESSNLRNEFSVIGNSTSKSASGFSELNRSGNFSSSFGADHDSPANRVSTLTRLGVPRHDAEVYAEGVRRGGVLLVGRVNDNHVDDALRIIEQHGPVDLDERHRSYRDSGWTNYDATAADYDATQSTEERGRYGTGLGAAAAALRGTNESTTTRETTTRETTTGVGTTGLGATTGVGATTGLGADREEHIPIVEENLHVGKRQVARGSLRVRSYVIETPVEETVRLRDETVHVERRPADLATGAVPADAFRERTIEVTETDEEAVVAKEARVREELVIRKDVEEKARTVSDTVRRTEVEIDDSRIDNAVETNRGTTTDRLATDTTSDRLTTDTTSDRLTTNRKDV